MTRILPTSAAILQVAEEDYNKPVIHDALEKHLEKLDLNGKIEALLVRYFDVVTNNEDKTKAETTAGAIERSYTKRHAQLLQPLAMAQASVPQLQQQQAQA